MCCIICWLRDNVTARGHYIVNGMSVCTHAPHLEAACKTKDPYEACAYLNQRQI